MKKTTFNFCGEDVPIHIVETAQEYADLAGAVVVGLPVSVSPKPPLAGSQQFPCYMCQAKVWLSPPFIAIVGGGVNPPICPDCVVRAAAEVHDA